MTNLYEIFSRRTQERLFFYNDESETDTGGAPTGRGFIQCEIYGPDGAYLGTFPDGGLGIAGVLVDDGPIGAMFTRNPTSIVEVRFPAGVYRSYDDGRTWVAHAEVPPAIRLWLHLRGAPGY